MVKRTFLKKLGVRKYVKPVVKALKKRYVRKGLPNVAAITRDVMMLKKMVNAEKKMIDGTNLSGLVGQVNANVGGGVSLDLTPTITQGIGYTNRNGRSLKFSGLNIRMQLNQQTSTHDGGKFMLYVVLPTDTSTTANAYSEFFDNDKLTGIQDFNSNRNPDYMKNFKIILKRQLTIRPDNYSGAPQVVKDYQFNLKLNHHLRYDKDTAVITEGQMLCFIVASSGNISTTTASTLPNVAHAAINTGFGYAIATRFWYYDN